MAKYRFKTREEFIRDKQWSDGCPRGWNNNGLMNCYMGQEIDDSYNTYIDNGIDFTMPRGNKDLYWHFHFTDIVLISDNKVDTIYEIY